MNGNYVVLILGVLVVAYLVYFTHTVVRGRMATRGAGGGGRVVQVRGNACNQLTEAARAAGENRSLGGMRLTNDVARARSVLGDGPTVRTSRCLWVDHDPDGIVHERRMVEHLHVDIDLARTTNQALQFLVGRTYDFVITDLTRPLASGDVDDRAGIKLLKMLAGAPTVPPVIVYADHIVTGTDDDAGDDAGNTEASESGAGDAGSGRGALPEPRVATPADQAAAAEAAAEAGVDEDDTTEDDTDGDDTAGDDGELEGDAGRATRGADPVIDERLVDARAAGARAAVTTPGALLQSVLDLVRAG